eukprot:TRINITY_DN8393_c0_g1_i1.p1 TRINITY_DN8393_c0_g1~~TRINITY_DN8393_c0_g1_i1.p1  ORF type:complete len:538 (+),score=176.46 TRINITY_DN8393_c0_g1_i1:28-1614(+)
MHDRRRHGYGKGKGQISAAWGILVILLTIYLWSDGSPSEDEEAALGEAEDALRQVRHNVDDIQREIETLHHLKHVEHVKVVDADEGQEGSNSGSEGSNQGSADAAQFAYVTVVSVESYVDGALVMGESLKKMSAMVQDGSCQLVCVASMPGVSDDSASRLRKVGWNVVQVKGLARHVPKAHWADSFDKLYIFSLTQFKRIVFVDSDMLAVKNPDKLFSSTKLQNESYIGAIGNNPKHHKGPYFQTGMLVLQPSKKVASDLFKLFHSESLPKKKHGIYNSLNARDGMLMRTYFGARYTTISNMYSKHLAPWEDASDVKMAHFRGSFKPWYNIASMFAKKPEELAFGDMYRKWWEYYDKLHKEHAGDESWSENDPSKYYWMLRHTDDAYFKKLSSVEEGDRNMTRTGLTLHKGKKGKSCDEVCKATSTEWCDEEALTFLHLSDCNTLKKAFSCSTCIFAEFRKDHPGAEAPCFIPEQDQCLQNFNMDPRMKAACSDKHASVARLCPCITSDGLKTKAERWTGQGDSMILT